MPKLRKLRLTDRDSGCQAFCFCNWVNETAALGTELVAPFIFSRGIRGFALIASQKRHDTLCFCLYRAINSGRELACAKKSLRLTSKRIVPSPIATPAGRRTYPENKTNRWLITRRCAVPQAKPVVSKGPGFSLLSLYIYGGRAEEPTTVNR